MVKYNLKQLLAIGVTGFLISSCSGGGGSSNNKKEVSKSNTQITEQDTQQSEDTQNQNNNTINSSSNKVKIPDYVTNFITQCTNISNYKLSEPVKFMYDNTYELYAFAFEDNGSIFTFANSTDSDNSNLEKSIENYNNAPYSKKISSEKLNSSNVSKIINITPNTNCSQLETILQSPKHIILSNVNIDSENKTLKPNFVFNDENEDDYLYRIILESESEFKYRTKYNYHMSIFKTIDDKFSLENQFEDKEVQIELFNKKTKESTFYNL